MAIHEAYVMAKQVGTPIDYSSQLLISSSHQNAARTSSNTGGRVRFSSKMELFICDENHENEHVSPLQFDIEGLRYWQQKPWALRPFTKHAEREQHFHTTMAPMTLHGTMIGFTNKIFLVVLVISIHLKNNLNTLRTWPMHSRKDAQLNIKQKDVSFMS